MSDSEKTNELDSYGVWVKKPPRTVDAEQNESLPDFSESSDSTVSKNAENADGMENVDLSDFGFSDSDESSESTVLTEGSEEIVENTDTEIKVSDAPVQDNGDGPIDIDLTFDDSAEVKMQDASTSETKTSSVDDGSESVDLSEFGFDDGSEKSESKNDDGTENVDLSEFGFSDDDSQESTAEKSPQETKDEGVRMNVVADDDEIENSSVAETSQSNNSQSTFGDDDFDLDNIINSVEDENGNKVSLSDEKSEELDADDIAKAQNEKEQENFDAEDVAKKIETGSTENAEKSEGKFEHDIPDTFDEEAASLMDDSESAKENRSEQEKMTAETNAILSQIVNQLSSLRNEISSLKQDVENMKSRSTITQEEPTTKEEQTENSESVAETPTEETEDTSDDIVAQSSSGGFFDDDDDDTIALSGDELDNILSTTEITDATEDETMTDESTEKALDAIEDTTLESVFDGTSSNDEVYEDFENESEQTDIEKESEVDDVLVEASTEPSIIEDESELDKFSFDEPVKDEETGEIEDISEEEIGDEVEPIENLDEKTEDEKDFLSSAISPEESDDSFLVSDDDDDGKTEEEIENTLTEENLDYLNSDPSLKESEPIEELADEESSIPSDLKNEIKSVLSYMDQLLENLPEEKIAEFAQSEQFETYKKLFKELGLS